MPTITKTVSNILAGKARLDCLTDFPAKDATAVGTYVIEISFDSGTTWRTLCGGDLRGDFTPTIRPADPTRLILLSVSHNGLACSLRITITINKVVAANFSVL